MTSYLTSSSVLSNTTNGNGLPSTAGSSTTTTTVCSNHSTYLSSPQKSIDGRSSSTAFVIKFDENTNEEPASNNLQEAFQRYRNEKIEGYKLNDANRNLKKSIRLNPKRRWKLRYKFLEQAKKYFGIPYAKKYFSPEMPEYNSKLFLDCCGLVRRVMRDLEKEFGFRIGSGNQAYMFDTLPKTIEKLEDVRPGDLVFISAIYYNPKMKKQPHNITHVEIMLGEGEKTIGARWNNGKVQVFDSYKFESKSYHSQKYYFKSIEPWLMGICKSYCHKHAWKYNTASKPSKKSIFSPATSNSTDSNTIRNANKGLKKSGSIKNLNTKKKHKKKRKKKTKTTKKINETQQQQQVDGSSQTVQSSILNIQQESGLLREGSLKGKTENQIEEDYGDEQGEYEEEEDQLDDQEGDDYEEEDDYEEDQDQDYDGNQEEFDDFDYEINQDDLEYADQLTDKELDEPAEQLSYDTEPKFQLDNTENKTQSQIEYNLKTLNLNS